MELVVRTASAEETIRLGEVLGRAVTVPLTIALTGDLGSGKTVFVQGLARGLEVPEAYYVTSPSYTLINEYPGRLPLYHVDLYRLAGGADLEDLELQDILAGNGVVAIEWAARIRELEFGEHLAVRIQSTDGSVRQIHMAGYGHGGSNLLRGLEKKLR